MEPSRTLLIVPPFASITRPALGIHVLQSVAREDGHCVDVLYANLILAHLLGESTYEAICEYPFMAFLGEHIMGWFAFEGEVAPPDPAQLCQLGQGAPTDLGEWRAQLATWRDLVEQEVRRKPYQVIGVSSTFDQTNASLLILRACRTAVPDATLIVGGANCEGDMADGIASHIDLAHHVFSGECEQAFLDFLRQPSTFAGQRIICGSPNPRVSDLPANDFAEYFAQLEKWLPQASVWAHVELPYESSRGCWWGQKHHCTFCGLNGQGMGFREKSAEKVLNDVLTLHEQHQQARARHPLPGQALTRILMTDNIMPRAYFQDLLPRLAQNPSGLRFFYEQKSNISLEKAMLLKQAGVDWIQPGIEALHTGLLKLMRKGVNSRQNLALLRYCRATNIHLSWNLLYGFPGEQEAWYQELLAFMPLLEHLQPPTGLYQLNIDRFSPFFSTPAELGFANLRPHPQYAKVFPAGADLNRLAYHFVADACGPTLANSPLLSPLQSQIQAWQAAWQTGNQRATPNLAIMELGADQYMLIDSRSHRTGATPHMLTRAQAQACLVEHKARNAASEFALQHGLAIEMDGMVVPLAIADPVVLQRFEQHACENLVATNKIIPIAATSEHRFIGASRA